MRSQSHGFPQGDPQGPLTLTCPADIVAALPYLVPGPPDPGIVVLALAEGGRVHSVLQADLDRVEEASSTELRAVSAVEHAAAARCGELLVVAFGPPERVVPDIDALLRAAPERNVTVLDAFRVWEGRYWSHTCPGPGCCPPEGRPLETDRSTAPADAVLRGIVPVAQLLSGTEARVRAVLGPVEEAALALVAARAEEIEAAERARPGRPEAALAAVRSAVRAEWEGAHVTGHAELAELGVYLTRVRVRDEAWARITERSAPVHERLWARVVRHVPARLRAAPASLLAVAAWQRDDVPLASAALEAALDADPDYSMALLMRRALDWGLPVERWRETAPPLSRGREPWGGE
ncbi:DUF4192 domain-containing protein [Nocardiopsis sp. CNT312]|uniref:DUF4192 domain-containing protein n=1 Tax=Nocardiopsis sp. CNT312 TaxID=1137268 RepID=UPI0004B33DB8|nr:DUF4192 domain-containing protein [Nocardiopsis sp. CNT312]